MTPVEIALDIASGSIVGLSLGLVGGGGSILAVPLLIAVAGVTSTHVAIGTSALAVAVNASLNLIPHARTGVVKWRCAAVFGAAGIAGAALGSTLGQWVDGDTLLAAFAGIMVATGIAMLLRRKTAGNPDVHLDKDTALKLLPSLLGLGLAVGTLAGFFGIGGGFLIVPGLMLATNMPMLNAVASSLVAVAAFGFTTAANYALNGLIDWKLAALFIVGGLLGGLVGVFAARKLSAKRGRLTVAFALIVFAAAAYVFSKGMGLIA